MPRPTVIQVLRERGVVGLLKAVARRVLRKRPAPTLDRIHVPQRSRLTTGIDVVGFFTAEHGVGEAARTTVETLRTAQIPLSTINYTDTQSRTAHAFTTDDVSLYRALLMSINADHLNAAYPRFGTDFFANRYVIGQWFWELEEAPSWYQPAFPLLDELWAPTKFIEQMLRLSAPMGTPITHVPLPVSKPEIDPTVTKTDLGLDDSFAFLFVFDFMSVMKRKNPIGLIEAFTSAFAPHSGPKLVIKAINGDKRLAEKEALFQAAQGRSDIEIRDEYLTRVETSSLIALADCYVSLHRSEGLGLTMCEAMALGKPVIATAYSGNMDFMNDSNSYLVPWVRTEVGDNAEGYDAHAHWAEPDISTAAGLMRYVYENREEARRKGQRAQADILKDFSVEACGAIMKSRLEQIWSSQSGA